MALDSYQDHYRKMVSRSTGAPLSDISFLKQHGELEPPVFSLKVEGLGLYFAMDVMKEDLSMSTYVVPRSDKVAGPGDVHAAYARDLSRS